MLVTVELQWHLLETLLSQLRRLGAEPVVIATAMIRNDVPLGLDHATRGPVRLCRQLRQIPAICASRGVVRRKPTIAIVWCWFTCREAARAEHRRCAWRTPWMGTTLLAQEERA